MKGYRFYIAALIFALLLGCRIFMPQQAAQLHEDLMELIDRNDDFEAIIQTMGEQLSESGIHDDIAAVFMQLRRPTDDVRY